MHRNRSHPLGAPGTVPSRWTHLDPANWFFLKTLRNMRRASLLGIPYFCIMPRWLADVEDDSIREMFRYIKAFGSTDVCAIDGCSFGTRAINPIAILVSGMPKLTVLLRNRTKGGCCIHGKDYHKGPLYDISEGAPLPDMLMSTIAQYICDHLMSMDQSLQLMKWALT